MKNDLVISLFRSMADLLEMAGENPFRIRAYRSAADNIASLEEDLAVRAEKGALRTIPGIGSDLAHKISEILERGTFADYEKMKENIPQGVLELMHVPSVGPRKAKLFYDRLRIVSLEGLKKAAQDGKLLGLPGIKQKTVDNILRGIELLAKGKEAMDLLTATAAAGIFVSALKKVPAVEKIAVAGSLRRMKDTVRDIDLLVASKDPQEVADAFVGLPQAKRVLAHGATKSAVLTKDGVQVDVRVVPSGEFGAAFLYFTGSKNHNIKLRQLALKKGWKINEYGLFDKRHTRLAAKSEEEIYAKLGLDFIAPELREDTGEVEAALQGRLPDVVSLEDIRGDFHAHTHYSDGRNSILEMARKAQSLGYEFLALTDHSVSLRVAHGLDESRLKNKRRELDGVNKRLKGFRVLFGTEVEIDAEGGIDYRDTVLSWFDIVIGAIHSGFKQSSKQLTRRIVRACRHKHVHIIAHPTGKLWPVRGPYDVDMQEVFRAARDTNTALEINAHPYSLDLSDVHARPARDSGVRPAV
ncbi:MAG: DNA polymerase/3'-5' exonuclease PolX, partial [Candidatus Omnitrophica bacterium]|nr:DNA polymerase/3'-5' exonuclease PolX [Candidatus Omnitrophota bacterium]